MPGMSGMSELAQLTWGRFLSTWHVMPGWLALAILLIGAYVVGWRAAGHESSVRPWRVASFVFGVALFYVCVAGGIGSYAMALFWMHMVLHLLLIMVVPAFLVMGHPITVLLEALQPRGRDRVERVIRSRPVSIVTNPAFGAALYTSVIVYTHLTGFMDQMAQHAWLMYGEQALYVVTGYIFLLPLIGEEPIRSNPPYLARIMILVAAMLPDTIVGLVLLQTHTVLYPVMMAQRPSWALDSVDDAGAAGGLMWAAGDGLMMFIAVGLIISVITTPSKRLMMTGAFLEGARRNAFIDHSGASESITDTDSDEAMDAYNRMLAKLNGGD
jgi:cytochrome c oxidase assembly factor CtaG